jgi:hypothetical protein
MLPVLSHTSLVPTHHIIIDCNADPFTPNEWKVEEHQRAGLLKWDAAQVGLYLNEGQRSGHFVQGHKLRQLLADKSVLNANVLDYLLVNPHLIPEEWKEDERGNAPYIFFWGSVYRRGDDRPCVRYLFWGVDGWTWDHLWLEHDWLDTDPAALLKT